MSVLVLLFFTVHAYYACTVKIEGLAQTYLSVSFLLPKGNWGNASPPCKVSDDIHTHLSVLLNDYVISKENITACKNKIV